MNNIPNAEQSPRIVNGVIYWYENDTFELQTTLDLIDQDGETITISPTDSVEVVFFDSKLEPVKEFTFSGIENNTVTLNFDAATTALFPIGDYTYDVYFNGTKRTTICNDNKVVVE